MKRVRTAALHDTIAEVTLVNSRGVSLRRREIALLRPRGDASRRKAGKGRPATGSGSPGRCAGSTPPRSPGKGRSGRCGCSGRSARRPGSTARCSRTPRRRSCSRCSPRRSSRPRWRRGNRCWRRSWASGWRPTRSPSRTIRSIPRVPARSRSTGKGPRGGGGSWSRAACCAGTSRTPSGDGRSGRGARGRAGGRAGRRLPPWARPTSASPPAPAPFDDLLAAAGDGILLTEFLGIHTADPVSGDFSVGASGIRISGGKLAEPLHGFAVSGNVLDLLRNVESAGSDFRWFGGIGAPSLLVGRIALGGD